MFRVIGTLLICLVVILSACDHDMNITEQILYAPNPELESPTWIPDWLKEKIWEDEDALVEELLALGENDTQQAIDLSHRIATRQLQDGFYYEWINADGIAIIGTRGGVNHTHFEIAREIVLTMTAKHPEIRELLHYDTGFYIVIFNRREHATLRGFPEFHQMVNLNSKAPQWIPRGVFLWSGACFAPTGGMNINGTVINTRVHYEGKTCKEMGYGKDGHWCGWDNQGLGWDVFIHEFAHAIHWIIAQTDSTFEPDLQKAYENAVEKELWTVKRNPYAKKDFFEYWAVNTESWFSPQRALENFNGKPAPEISQKTFKELDPKLYKLLSEWYPKTELNAGSEFNQMKVY